MPADTSTVTSVAAATSATTIAAANTARRGLFVYNDSSATLFLKLGTGATTTSYTVQVAPAGYWELPTVQATRSEVLGGYSGAVTGVWASATGSARVTEVS